MLHTNGRGPTHALVLLALLTFAPGLLVAQGEVALPKAVGEAKFPARVEELRGIVRFLSHDRMRGRAAGSAEDGITAVYIASEFERAGLEPGVGDGWEQRFSFAPRDGSEPITTQNIVGRLPGQGDSASKDSARHVIVCGHHDHLGVDREGNVYNGADDNASGIAGMVAIARALRSGPVSPKMTILFIAFGGEESGLRGAKHYVENPLLPLDQLAAVINLDMISRPRFLDSKDLVPFKAMLGLGNGPGVGLLGGEKAPRLLGYARAACKVESIDSFAPQDFPMLREQIRRMTEGRDDSSVFRARGIRTLFLSTAEHDDYHRPTDTIDTISFEVLERVAAVAWRTVLAVSFEEAPPKAPNEGEPEPEGGDEGRDL